MSPTSPPERIPADWLSMSSATNDDFDDADDDRRRNATSVRGDSTTTAVRRKCSPTSCAVMSVSALMIAFFTMAAAFQGDDPDTAYWVIFYGLHALIPCCFLIRYCQGIKKNNVMTLATLHILHILVFSWSIVIVVLTWLELRRKKHNSININLTGTVKSDSNWEGLVWEMGGAGIGIFNTFFHSLALYWCASSCRRRSNTTATTGQSSPKKEEEQQQQQGGGANETTASSDPVASAVPTTV